MKTYVVIGSYGKYENHTEQVIYAGDDRNIATSFDFADCWEDLELQVWLNGTEIQGYYKEENIWKLEFDKTLEIKKDIEKLQKELSDKENLLELLEKIK